MPSRKSRTPHSTFHPWPRLPHDLQLRVLDFRLHLTRPLTEPTHTSHIHRGIRELSLVNSTMRRAALRVYYGNGVLLKRHSAPRLPAVTFAWDFWHPRPEVGMFVRKVQLQLIVDDKFVLPTCRKFRAHCDWFLLLRPTVRKMPCNGACGVCAANKARSDWQVTLPNLAFVDLQIGVYRLSGHAEIRAPGRCVARFKYEEYKEDFPRRRGKGRKIVRTPRKTVRDVLDGIEVLFNPSVVRIEVVGFACEGCGKNWRIHDGECEYGCGRKIAAEVKEVFEVRKLRTK